MKTLVIPNFMVEFPYLFFCALNILYFSVSYGTHPIKLFKIRSEQFFVAEIQDTKNVGTISYS